MADPNPFNLAAFKETVRSSALGRKASAARPDHSEELFTMSLALSAAVKKIFYDRSETKFSEEPAIAKRPILRFMRSMRVDALAKFNQAVFFASVHLYKSAAAMAAHDPAGVLFIYMERRSIPEVLRLLKYPYIDYDDDTEVLDGVGAVANLVAGQFKRELARLGYADLELSHFRSYANTAVNGVACPDGPAESYEVSFEIDGEKRLVAEMVMTPLPRQDNH